jgi:AcrR family transcriptional regulator
VTSRSTPIPAAALTPAAIVSRAIRIADAEGLERLTMRRLASELSVTPMAMYWHFPNKAALIERMVERVVGQVVVEDPTEAPWQERLRAVLATTLDVLVEHPWLGRMRRRIVITPDYLHIIETLLDIMHTAGYDAETAVIAVDTALDGVALLAGRLGDVPVLPSPGPDVPGPDVPTSTLDQLRDLGPAGYPRIAAAAQALTSADSPQARDLVVEILVRGIEAAAPQPRR